MNVQIKAVAVLMLAIVISKVSNSQQGFGIKAGLNFANVNVERNNNTIKPGVNAGVMMQIPIGDRFFLHPELLYSIKGYKESKNINLYYINLPLLLGYKVTSNLNAMIGLELGYLEDAKLNPPTNGFDIYHFYKKFDNGVDLGAQYQLNKNFGIDLRYNYGFKDLEEVTLTDPYGNFIKKEVIGSNRVIEISLLYFFDKKKK